MNKVEQAIQQAAEVITLDEINKAIEMLKKMSISSNYNSKLRNSKYSNSRIVFERECKKNNGDKCMLSLSLPRLMSKQEYSKYKEDIPAIPYSWFLSNRARSNNYVLMVNRVGGISAVWQASWQGYRPVIKVYNAFCAGLKKGDRFSLNDTSFIMIDKDMAIATWIINLDCFDNYRNYYDLSYVCSYLRNWL